MIHDREDGVESCTRRQCCDEVHSDGLKGKGESSRCYSVRGGSVRACEPLVLLAHCAALNVVRDPGGHLRPPEGLRYPFFRPVSTWMAGRRSVMVASQN